MPHYQNSDNNRSNDGALIDPPRRIPLTKRARRAQRKLQLACLFSLLFMFAEVVGGFFAGSLAIMTDAAHLFSDVAGFCISLFAIWISARPATAQLTFGFHRSEAIGAVTSVLVIWILTGVLVYAAVGRFVGCLGPYPEEHVDGKFWAMATAMEVEVTVIHTTEESIRTKTMTIMFTMHHRILSAVVTIVTDPISPVTTPAKKIANKVKHTVTRDVEIGHRAEDSKPNMKQDNLNIRSAYIHALGDFIQSIGVCIAGGLIWLKPEWQIADPIATFLFSVLVLLTMIDIVRDSIHTLMEGAPADIDVEEIERGLRACSSVVSVHDLHIWSLSADLPSLSVHLVSTDAEAALLAAQQYLVSKGITHSTIQLETPFASTSRDCKSGLKCGQVALADTS